jgi:hypothetical protein
MPNPHHKPIDRVLRGPLALISGLFAQMSTDPEKRICKFQLILSEL